MTAAFAQRSPTNVMVASSHSHSRAIDQGRLLCKSFLSTKATAAKFSWSVLSSNLVYVVDTALFDTLPSWRKVICLVKVAEGSL